MVDALTQSGDEWALFERMRKRALPHCDDEEIYMRLSVKVGEEIDDVLAAFVSMILKSRS
jgi:hypothetical protein